MFYAVYVRDNGDPIIPWSRLNQGPFNPVGYPNWELGLNTNSALLPSYIYINEMPAISIILWLLKLIYFNKHIILFLLTLTHEMEKFKTYFA